MYEELVEKLRHRGTLYNGISLFDDAANAIETLESELNRLKRERDQAIKDLRHKDVCDICIGSLNELEGCNCECLDCKLKCRCRNCIDESLWQWRGVQEENNG